MNRDNGEKECARVCVRREKENEKEEEINETKRMVRQFSVCETYKTEYTHSPHTDINRKLSFVDSIQFNFYGRTMAGQICNDNDNDNNNKLHLLPL